MPVASHGPPHLYRPATAEGVGLAVVCQPVAGFAAAGSANFYPDFVGFPLSVDLNSSASAECSGLI